jgi:signal transduction histidine kinase
VSRRPLADQATGADGQPTAPSRPILVVDDDPTLCQLIEVVLRRDAGLSVLSAGSLAEARAILARDAIGAVLLDITLPDGDGLAFLRELVAAGVRPVVMLTGTDAAGAAVEAMRAGAADYIVKADGVAVLLPAVLSRAIQAEQRDAARSVERAAVPLEPLLFELWDLADESDRQGHRLELELEPELRVWADPTGLQQLLQALLANALRYSPGGGPIKISAARRQGGIALSVADRGLGFDATAAGRLFEPLFRVESDHTHGVRGLGLGLTTARSIVDAHGGRIAAYSDGPGRGARFDVWLPDRPAA